MVENTQNNSSSKQEILLKTIHHLDKNENFNKAGQVIEGEILNIDKKAGVVHLDLGLRAEAAISIKEFFKKDEKANLEIGQKIKVKLVTLDYRGSPLANHMDLTREESFLAIKEIYQKPEEERILKGIPFAKIGRVVLVDVGGFICLLPINQIELRTINESAFTGTLQNFKIIKIEGENVLLSKKSILNEEEIKEVGAFMEMVKENDLVEAEVKAIFPYGAFATIKSIKSTEEENFSEIKSSQITGFIYIQDISWDKINHPSECLEIGQKIKAKVLKNKNETSKGEQNKIALSIKELTKNPKAQLLEEFKEGEAVNCKVTELSEHGIFAHFSKKAEGNQKQENCKQYEGFIHNSEISWEKEEQNNKKFKTNDQFEAKIIELDIDKKKVPLSIKSLQESPVKIYCQNFKENDILELKISKALQYGLILTLSDKLEIFIHAKDILWEKDKDSYEYLLRGYKPDDLIKVKYLGYCDTLNRVKLTTKGFNNNEDPFVKYKDSLTEGKIIDVSVVDIKVDKVYVSIFGALISTVKSFEFPKNLTPSDLKIGQAIKVKIIGFEDSANSIPILSIKEQETEEYKKAKEKYNTTTQSTSSLAEILEFALDKAAKKNA